MAEADFSSVTAHMPNTLRDRVAAYGRDRHIFKKVRMHSLEGVQTVDTVNMSDTICTIIEEFFDLASQKPGGKRW